MASLRERKLKNGITRYVAIWRDPESKKQTSHPFDTKQAAEQFIADLEANGHQLSKVIDYVNKREGDGQTVQQVIEEHLAQLDGVEKATLAKNYAMARKHIYPALGEVRAQHLTRADVVGWINGLEVSPKTAKNIHAVLSSSLNTAVREGNLNTNVAYGVKPPKPIFTGAEFEAVFLSKFELEQIIEHTPKIFKGLMILLANTGLRYGEATALQGKDLSTDDDGRLVLQVRRAWKGTGTKDSMYLGEPKTRQSRRAVTLSRSSSAALRPYLTGVAADDFLFTINGHFIPHWIFRDQAWTTSLKAAGITSSPRIHDLRHSHASALLRAGVPMHLVSRRLGHSSIKTTVDKYGHLMTTDDATAADLLD